jgi:hypothetical protein
MLSQDEYCAGCVNVVACNVVLKDDGSVMEVCGDRIERAEKKTLRTEGGELMAGDHVVLKGWESFSGWYWFGVERIEDTPGLWYGFVQGLEEEWGYFSTLEFGPLIAQGRMWPIKACDLPYAGRRMR